MRRQIIELIIGLLLASTLFIADYLWPAPPGTQIDPVWITLMAG